MIRLRPNFVVVVRRLLISMRSLIAVWFAVLVTGCVAQAEGTNALQATDAELRSRFAELKTGMTTSQVRARMGVEPQVKRGDLWEFRLSRASDTPEEIDWKLLVAFKDDALTKTEIVYTCIYRKERRNSK